MNEDKEAKGWKIHGLMVDLGETREALMRAEAAEDEFHKEIDLKLRIVVHIDGHDTVNLYASKDNQLKESLLRGLVEGAEFRLNVIEINLEELL
jgi:hypothetical protein